jgi:hypothetical protein
LDGLAGSSQASSPASVCEIRPIRGPIPGYENVLLLDELTNDLDKTTLSE